MRCVVVVPVYKPVPSRAEIISLMRLKQLNVENVVLVGPGGLDLTRYWRIWPDLCFESFNKQSFDSISSYNALLLSKVFYERFSEEFEWLLIHQLDAFLLNREIGSFCELPYDYFGAPWRVGQLLLPFTNNARVLKLLGRRVHVGNGGLSLRRIGPTIKLLERKRFYAHTWKQNEDAFFSYYGAFDKQYRSCTADVACTFAVETDADYWYGLTKRLPFGCHAFEKHNSVFRATKLEPLLSATVAETE